MPGKGRRRRKVGVCIECRQQKLRCNTEDTYPDPCTRCVLKGVQCTIDATFKRTAARERTREIEAELMRLRQERATTPRNGQDDTTANDGAVQGPQIAVRGRLNTKDIKLRPATLGQSTFKEEDIEKRFAIFSTHFHHPFLSLPLPIAALQEHSPFLFWTVITITCRYYRLPDQELRALETSYTALAQKASTSSPMTLHTIQAILLICTWPLTPRHGSHDPGYLYCSAAIGGASFLNLDRQVDRYLYHDSQITEKDLQNMSRTWIGLFCVSSTLEMWYGTPKYFHHALDIGSVETHIQRSSLPEELAAEAAMTAILARVRRSRTPKMVLSEFDTMTESSKVEIDRLMRRCNTVWSDKLQFTALSIQMRLLSLSILEGNVRLADSNDMQLAGKLRATIPIATGVVETYASLLQTGGTVPFSIQYHILPKSYFRTLLFTLFFLLEFCCSNEALGPLDRMESRRVVERARAVFLSCSERPSNPDTSDEPGRAAEALRLLLAHVDEPTTASQSYFDDRGESSIVWEALRRVRRLHGRSSSRTDLLRFIDPIGYAGRAVEEPKGVVTTNGVQDYTIDDSGLGTLFDDQTFEEAFHDFSNLDWI